MYQVLIVVHTMITFALIGIILVQRNAGDGLGLSGSSSNSFMSGRSAANFITRTTAILATIFIVLSLAIGVVTANNHKTGSSIMQKLDEKQSSAPTISKPQSAPTPAKPSVPRPE
ncbi:MAG: preprotein translocase subunit SecG [Pseudomonadota bacterium]